MKTAQAFILRTFLAGFGYAAVLRFCYGPATKYDDGSLMSYMVVCIILSACSCVGWMLRPKRTRTIQVLSSAAIAFALCLGLIWLSEVTNFVNEMPWQYFYKDDYIVIFRLIAPITVAVATGLLCLIPERTR
jgi:hypothetical protein